MNKKPTILKTAILAIVTLFVTTNVFAYSINTQDQEILGGVYRKIDAMGSKSREKILAQIDAAARKTQNERFRALLGAISSKYSSLGSAAQKMYRVVKVVDGDTIDVESSGSIVKIRILGLDTPEKYTTRTGYKECYGDEASARATELLEGKTVGIESDETQDKTDKYDRTLAHVFIGGELYQEKVIREGYGFRYVYKTPTKYDDRLLKAEQDAKLANVGVWAKCEGKRKPIDQVISETQKSVETIVPPSNLGSTPIAPAIVPPVVQTPGTFSCSVSKNTCSQMNSCAEARYYLTSCGVSRLDGDKDGTPCESLCK